LLNIVKKAFSNMVIFVCIERKLTAIFYTLLVVDEVVSLSLYD